MLAIFSALSCSSDDAAPSGTDAQAKAGRDASGDSAAGSGGRDASARGGAGAGGSAKEPTDAGALETAADGGGNELEAGRGGSGGSGGAADGGGAPTDPAEPAEATPEAIAAGLAAAVCEALESCVGASKLAALNDREDCGSRIGTKLLQDDFGSLSASIEAGAVELDPSQLDACYTDTRALGCDVQTGRLPESCQRAIAGQREAGESCSIDADCVRETFCPVHAECPRTCEAAREAGAECRRDAECQRGTICNAGRCAAPAEVGQSCAGDSGAVCVLGASCVGSTDTQAGTCRTNASVQAGELGASCSPGGTLCEEGLSCAYDSGSSFQCQAAVGAGETCKLALPSQCPVDTYCSAADVTSTGTCDPLPKHGEACVLGDECAPGHVCVVGSDTATCRAIADLGEPCSTGAACRSGFCDAGRCELRARCP